ncbi:MAG TPA: oxidoreductase [Vicinamibacterales bacterium]|nr:oxidoreductase [Vicinamibacterales bacterium]
MPTFNAFRISQTGDTIAGAIVNTSLDELTPGNVVIKAAYSSVNYKDALAATGAAKIMKTLPLVGGIDVAGVVSSSSDARFKAGDQVVVTGYDLGVANDGGYSAYVRVPADWIVTLPPSLSLFDAMALGTAGFTAALSVIRLEQNGLKPGAGPVVVTGATGGVGSIAVAILAGLGYDVTAVTGKDGEHEYLKSLGAKTVLPRSAIDSTPGPIGKATWAGAVDPVGGNMLASLAKTMAYGASIANSGLTGGIEVHTTVIPFILRGVNLLGIDSVMCPMAPRLEVWRRLASDMKPKRLASIAREIPLAGLPDAFATLAKGGARGRYVVNVAE